ncbi:MAG TPA: GntR family transcriptional regulator [Verrucomicrobiales bacterium]|nr:GntR family transcriptional regulator [Verrucomicrobiales bacterium]HRJ10407.1 GntR family transcriptional regulator [Prosthecobacter sp.]HRK15455.1 GntR family transcriptional regulator [Prosthecobacter sp.]
MPASSSPSPVRLQSRAYAELRRLIASGEFPPGTFLSERQLAAQLGMSKTPVHVALERLESEGFVTISAQQGVVVRGLSVEDIVDHYELREAVESWVVRRLAGRLKPAQVEELNVNLASQRQALAENDLRELMRLDEQMHYLLASYLGNREILSTMERLRDKIHQVILRVTDTDRARPAESTAEHETIIAAIIAGQPDEAARLMIAHLEAGKRRILNPERFA